MGKAVVCPNFGGFSEILGCDNEGLYKKGDNIDMIRVISNLLKNSKLRKNLEKQNLRTSKNYNIKSEVDKLDSLYSNIFLNL